MADTVESYEAAQNFTGVNAWLHGFRFRQIVRTALALARDGEMLNVLEIGCAYGKAYAALDAAAPIRYVGVDTHAGFVAEANRRYGARENFRAVVASADAFVATEGATLGRLDLVFALETLEHMPEGRVRDLLESVAKLKPRMFAASVPVEVGPSILFKNIGSALVGYQRHKEYTLSDTLWSSVYRLDKVPAHKNGHRGFDWRRLARDIEQNLGATRIRKFPAALLPSWFAASVFIEARMRD